VEARVSVSACTFAHLLAKSSLLLATVLSFVVDLQMVQIAMRVLYKPDPHKLTTIYRRLGKGKRISLLLLYFPLLRHIFTLLWGFAYAICRPADFEERVLPSIVNEVTKAVVAQYNASELLTKRNVVSKQIRDLLTARSAEFNILLDDVAITHLAFSREYTAAVEAKQVAQQESERARYIVDRAIQEKKSIIIKAQGEAQAAHLIGNVCFIFLHDVLEVVSLFILGYFFCCCRYIVGHPEKPCLH
jgi:prohibitin 2